MKKHNFNLLLHIMMLATILTVNVSATDASETEYVVFDEPFIDLSMPETESGGELRLMSEDVDPYAEMKATIVEALNNAEHEVSDVKGEDVIIFTVKNTTGDSISKDDIKKIYYNAIYDHPEQTYFAKTGYYLYYTEGQTEFAVNEDITIGAKVCLDRNTKDEFTAAVDAACMECFGGISQETMNQSMTDLEKIVTAHDWIAANCQYDPYVGESASVTDGKYTSPTDGTEYGDDAAVFTPYGVFVKHNAVCQGYALAFKTLMDRAGIDCCYCSSESMSHGWNMVKLGDAWYHIDCTWDDPVYIGSGDIAGKVQRKYMLLADLDFETADEDTGRSAHTGWSTEFNYRNSGGSYTLPAVVQNTDLPVFLSDSSFYVMGTGSPYTLYDYTVGNNFDGVSKTTELEQYGYPPTAAAFCYADKTLYYLSYGTTVYKVTIGEMNSPEECYTFTDSTFNNCGLTIRKADDTVGTYTLYARYLYGTVASWEIGAEMPHTSIDNAEAVIYYPQNLTLKNLPEVKLVLNVTVPAAATYQVLLTSYGEDGKMIGLEFLTVNEEDNTIHVESDDIAEDTQKAKILVCSTAGKPLSEQLEISNSIT